MNQEVELEMKARNYYTAEYSSAQQEIIHSTAPICRDRIEGEEEEEDEEHTCIMQKRWPSNP